MNLFQLVLKQMRQRALSTWLTLLSVVLGSTLAIGVIILQRESGNLFVQTDFGYDVLIGVKGSPMQLVLNTIYHVDASQGNIPYVIYEARKLDRANTKFAVPYVVGDTYKNHRVVGTLPSFFGFDDEGKSPSGWDDTGRLKPGFARPPLPNEDPDPSKQTAAATFEYRLGHRFTLSAGRVFHPRKFEAVIGSEITDRTGLKLGDKFKVTHAAPAGKATEHDEHDEQWTVVGVLDRTGTAEDRVVYISLISFYAIPQHEEALEVNFAAKQGLPIPPKRQPATAPAATTKAAHKHDHGHDHHGHDHKHHKRVKDPDPWDEDESKTKSPATTKAATTTASTKPHKHDDHDHHDHDHDHDHGKKPATTASTKPDAHAHDDHDHHDDHGDHDHHGHAHEHAYVMKPDGTIDLKLSKDKWQLSAILVKARSGYAAILMQDMFRRGDTAMAVNPASVMREFFDTFLKPGTQVLMIVVLIVVVTAAVSILVSIYNAVSARTREIAIMRALGATRGKILTLICVEAGLIGLIGGVLGMLFGHGLGAVISGYFARKMGTGINYLSTSPHEWLYLAGVVALSVLAGLVPGLKAYRTPVATNLVAA